MLEQAGAGGKDRIERQARLLQRNGAKEGNIEVRPRSWSQTIGAGVERLYRVKCTERAPRIVGELELPIDPLCQYGLMVPVVHDEHWTLGKMVRQLTLQPFPG